MTEDSPNPATVGRDVFVSCASQDVAVADAIVATLEKNAIIDDELSIGPTFNQHKPMSGYPELAVWRADDEHFARRAGVTGGGEAIAAGGS